MMRSCWLLLLASLAVGCTSAAGEQVPPQPEIGLPLLGSDCDPLVPEYCGLPFPSNVYLQDDPTGLNPSGKSVRVGPTTLPARLSDGAHMPPSLLFDHDGFSPGQAAMTYLPFASLEGCASPFDIERSLDPDSPTVLIEADTGRRVPHWVDLDESENDGREGTTDERLLLIRPAERLKDGTRYIVAIRNIVDRRDGSVIPAGLVFDALKDSRLLDDDEGDLAAQWTVFARNGLYADIFERLRLAGVERDDLQIAWDYTTATRENITGYMVEMRDLALEAVGDDGPTFTVVGVDEDFNAEILRRIEVEMEVPLFLTSASKVDGADDLAIDRLFLNPEGRLQQNGTMRQRVVILVPRSVSTGRRHGLMQNGHGLFGARTEGNGSYLSRTAADGEYIAFATNLFGFDSPSLTVALEASSGNFGYLKSFTERQIQGMVNQLMAMRMMRGRVAQSGITDADGNLLLDPAWIDDALRVYRGDSQGGIMGATYMAISTDVVRGALLEPGMPYNLLLGRSASFEQFFQILGLGFGKSAVTEQLALAVAQMGWDRAEPNGFAPYLGQDTLPGTPQHRVMIYAARGDHLVSTFGAHVMARAIGASHLLSDDAQVHEPIFGLPEVSGPLDAGSVYIEYDFGLAPNPRANLPNTDGCDPHERIRRMESQITQTDRFFRTGEIAWTCNGVCDCVDPGGSATEETACRATFASQCQ